MMNTASKQRPVEKENWIRVENTHEPIIDRQLWDKVQKLLTKKHRDIDLETNKNIFAGFIKCGDCGRAMMKNFWRRADGSKSYSFYCGTYKRSGKDYCTPHTLPFQVLNDIVLGDLKQIIRNVENLQELVKSQSFTATKIRKSTDITKHLHRLAIFLFVKLHGYIECIQKFFSGSRFVKQRIISNQAVSFQRIGVKGFNSILRQQSIIVANIL